ncbi:MAG: EF-hand domain-containing protein [Pseudomonadota bacterium]
MSVSSVSSSSAYALQWPSLSGTDSTNQSGAPSEALISLFQAFQGGQTNGMGPPPPPPDGSSGGASQFSSDTMSTMISMLGGQDSGASPLDNLMSKLDTDGDGKISQSEFEKAMGSDADKTKADALFAKMDKDGDGSVTEGELAQAIQKAHGGHHHHHGGAQQADGSQGTDPLQALLSGQGADGSSSQSTANSDGSTTTTITYADGTKISMTSPAASASSSSNGSDSTSGTAALNAMNLKSIIEKMIAAQAQMFTQQQQTGTNVSV